MDSKKAEQLLERYYAGDSTLEEEAQLRSYFAQEQVPEHLQPAQVQFRFLAHAGTEKMEQEIESPGLTVVGGKLPLRKRMVRYISYAAASVLLLAGIWYAMPSTSTNATGQYGTYSNPEKAYNETKQALLLISAHLNKGTKDVNKLKKLHQAQEHIRTKH